jgi:isopentenyl-diphosphate delta-isomerase
MPSSAAPPRPGPDHGQRKSDHLDLTISGDVGFRRTTLLEEVTLVHDALPELSLSELDLSIRMFGKRVSSPVVIASMTGGTERAERINRSLAEIAEGGGHALGLGSQRPVVRSGSIDPAILRSYQVRDIAPSVPVFANLGVMQAAELPVSLIEDLIAAVSADALCLHMNVAQELIQPGGDRDFRGAVDTLRRLAGELSVPVIAKETGCGVSRRTAQTLAAAGVQHVDVSGAGGTSWVGVETRRASGDAVRQGQEFWDWGIPTAASLLQVRQFRFRSVIATGGIQTGLDVARAIALGATACGIARPVLKALDAGGVAGARAYLAGIEADLRAAMLLTGSRDLQALRQAPRLLGTTLRAWSEV